MTVQSHSWAAHVNYDCWHMQAKDARFCNAGVEFDLASLKPTYRLIWGSVGASNALAVAEGLGFDPLIIAKARKVCNLPTTVLLACLTGSTF